ncbi:hypothetical protein HAX54_012029 [Datura stramonium]|uniref:Uncharacterized protein n=1 Tax=Datura stramonium TaxID=4076 RepID=A0ABS8TJ63_DATST|nr:hypothetical protein [Datura stramonium]
MGKFVRCYYFRNGDIEVRSLPDLELVERTSLMSVLRWNFKPNMDRAMSSSENGHITLANGSEMAFVSLLASENDFRIPESLLCLFMMGNSSCSRCCHEFSTEKKKQGGGPNILGTLVKGFKGKRIIIWDLSQMSKSNFSHLEDDIEIDEPVPVASTSSHNSQNSKRGTEREKLLDSESDDAKPRLRTREEIIAKYRKAGDDHHGWTSKRQASGTPRKLERISQRTE